MHQCSTLILLDIPSWQGIWVKPPDILCWRALMARHKTVCCLDQGCMCVFDHCWQVGVTGWVSWSYWCHRLGLCSEARACRPKVRSLGTSVAAWVYMCQSGPCFVQPTWTPAEFCVVLWIWCIGALVDLCWVPWEELWSSWLHALLGSWGSAV